MKFGASFWLVLQLFPLLAVCGGEDLLQVILNATKAAVDCASCHELVVPLKELALRGDQAFINISTEICLLSKAEDADVCVGTWNLQGPILAHSLRNIDPAGDTASRFCLAAYGLCDSLPVTPHKVQFPREKPAHPRKWVSTGKKPFQVAHFSDVHIDRSYTVGADANCTKNICCRNYADHVGPILVPAEPFGNIKCDTPPDLASSMLDAIAKLIPTNKFAIFTGDVVEGATWIEDKAEGTRDLAAWNEQMASKVGYPVYASLGNHDSAPVNSFPRDTTKTPFNSQWVFDTQSAGWKRWINETAARQVDHESGVYAVVVPGTKLRLIAVNTQYWYRQNFWLYDTDKLPADPSGILEFMVSQLQEAEDAGERAWIFGHIPPGKADTLHDQSNYYDQILQRYINTIAGQFFGHSHKDQFEIAYSDWNNQTAENAIAVGLIGPALTPTSGNPAFKVYDIDPDTYEVHDAKVYMANTSHPGFQQNPTWELYYSARESYGSMIGGVKPEEPLGGSFWHKVTEVFEKNETAFQLWNTRISRGGAVTPCTGDCITTSICDQRALRSENNCDVVTPGFAFGKRDLSRTVQEADECEGGLSTHLRNIVARLQER